MEKVEKVEILLDFIAVIGYNIIKSMKDKGILITQGRGKDKKYYLK